MQQHKTSVLCKHSMWLPEVTGNYIITSHFLVWRPAGCYKVFWEGSSPSSEAQEDHAQLAGAFSKGCAVPCAVLYSQRMAPQGLPCVVTIQSLGATAVMIQKLTFELINDLNSYDQFFWISNSVGQGWIFCQSYNTKKTAQHAPVQVQSTFPSSLSNTELTPRLRERVSKQIWAPWLTLPIGSASVEKLRSGQ